PRRRHGAPPSPSKGTLPSPSTPSQALRSASFPIAPKGIFRGFTCDECVVKEAPVTTGPAHRPSTAGHTAHRLRPASGWLTFAGTLAMVIGAFNIIAGLVALFNDNYYLVSDNQILVTDFTTWGGFWLAVGIVQVVVGAAIMAGRMWA